MRVLITGGAGFVGGNLAVGLASRHPDWQILALDSLHRRGSELNLPRLREAGVQFVQGDVRDREDLAVVGQIDALVECSAEPSVLAGIDGSLDYLVGTNLFGAFACLELCRRHDAQFVFLSTSRVYPVARLCSASLEETETRFRLAEHQPAPGLSAQGVSESFPLDGARTFYGTTKLSAEHLVEEYAATFGLATVVNRFGVIAGPWQMGKVDQGVLAYWLLAHHFVRPLEYIGFGGSGKQVRDVLHVDDAVDLIDLQLADRERWAGAVVNAGGGLERSVSLLELTELCHDVTGRTTQVTASSADRPGDIPLYVSDCRHLFSLCDWRPRRDVNDVLRDLHDWIVRNEDDLRRMHAWA
jgi:CDP-paratose 2-epimerase